MNPEQEAVTKALQALKEQLENSRRAAEEESAKPEFDRLGTQYVNGLKDGLDVAIAAVDANIALASGDVSAILNSLMGIMNVAKK